MHHPPPLSLRHLAGWGWGAVLESPCLFFVFNPFATMAEELDSFNLMMALLATQRSDRNICTCMGLFLCFLAVSCTCLFYAKCVILFLKTKR